MHIVANDREFDIDENTSLLQALQQQGVAANFSCRNGNCGLCEAHLNDGRVWLDDRKQLIDAPTTLLLCRAFARCDLNLKIDIASRAVSRYCRVLRVEKIADGYRVEIQSPAGKIPVLLADDFVQLEGNTTARLLRPLVTPSENSQRKLILDLRDDDVEWLEAINKGGIRIQLPA
jgi:ferredoxin